MKKDRRTKDEMELKKKMFPIIFKKYRGHISKTCEELRIMRKTYYEWIEQDPDFNDECQEVIYGILDDIEQGAFDIALDKDHPQRLRSILEILKVKKPKEWGTKPAEKQRKEPIQIIIHPSIPRPKSPKKKDVIEIDKNNVHEIEYQPLPSEDEEDE